MADITELISEVMEHYSNIPNEKQKLPEGAGTNYYYWACNEDTSTV